MRKIVLMLLFIAFFCNNQFAQKLIDTKKVPETITKRFAKSYRSAKEIKWFLTDLEHNYIVKFLNGGFEAEVTYNKSGKEIASKKEVDPDKLNGKIYDDLDDNHGDKKIHRAFLIATGPKDKYYSIILHKSQGRKKEPLVYEIQYSTTGTYLTIYEPDIAEEEEEEEVDKYEQEMDEEVDDLDEVEYDEKIKKDDLPSSVVSYISDNYDADYRYKDIRIRTDAKYYGDHYYVVMKKQGEKKLYHHYFDIHGKLILKRVEEL